MIFCDPSASTRVLLVERTHSQHVAARGVSCCQSGGEKPIRLPIVSQVPCGRVLCGLAEGWGDPVPSSRPTCHILTAMFSNQRTTHVSLPRTHWNGAVGNYTVIVGLFRRHCLKAAHSAVEISVYQMSRAVLKVAADKISLFEIK